MGVRVHDVFFKDTQKALTALLNLDIRSILHKYGAIGCDMLEEATPKDSGITAHSWTYEIEERSNGLRLHYCNVSENQGASIVILLQYGHGLWQGGYIEGTDFLNPVSKKLFEQLYTDVVRAVHTAWQT